jgi:hypothetical protein
MASGSSPTGGSSGSTFSSSKSREDTRRNAAAGASSAAGQSQDAPEKKVDKKPNFIIAKARGIWKTLGLDAPTLITMFRAALAPTIALAFYQSTAVAHYFTTLGYLVAIASILAVPIMPRAKFLQTLLFNVLATCVGASISLLALWTSIQARNHTQAPGTPLTAFNSSQAAVCAIWLFFEVYLINTIRSAKPQFVFPAILTSIFAVVSMSYGPSFPTMASAISFARRLLVAFLTGFGIATGVSLFVFPVTSRKVVFKEMTGYVMSLRGVLKAQMGFFQSLETVDMFRDPLPAAAAVKGAGAGLKALHAKMAQDLTFGKRDFAYGHLDADDIAEIARLLRLIMLPMTGMSSLVDILHRVSEQQGYGGEAGDDPELEELEHRAVEEYHLLMKSLHGPFEGIAAFMDEAMTHILLTLKFIKAPKTKNTVAGASDDIEAKAESVKAGDKGFSAYYEQKIDEFYQSRDTTLKDWFAQKGLGMPPGSYRDHVGRVDWAKQLELVSTITRQRNQRELFVALYMEYLMWVTSKSILDLVRFADKKVEDGTMTKKRLILPGRKRMNKWVMGIFNSDTTQEDMGAVDAGVATSGDYRVSLGQAYGGKKDPEHLPATSMWQRFGNGLRKMPHFLRSDHSVFGFRVACAVMSISIVAFLGNTHLFFLKQRLFWASIMISISMNRLAGQSVFNFIVRVLGSFFAMVATYVIYYIVNKHTAGVIVFEFIWIFCCFWIVVKRPRFIVVGIISSVTSVLIIGYELQVDKIGVVLSETNFQLYYPLYELAPYRLACVAGGLLVAFIWTIFPYPISENSELRKDLGSIVYSLAGHYAIVHETVRSRVRGDEGDPNNKNSPGRRLEKARLDTFAREILLLQTLKANVGFQTWQLEIGGKFPKKNYLDLIAEAEELLMWMNLIAFSSKSFALTTSPESDSRDEWQIDFVRLLSTVETTSEQVSSRLALLSNAISNATPLPPYLQPLEPFNLDDKLRMMDKEILSINHVKQPGYAAFAVMQIASRSVIYELNKLTASVKDLVGELDFSFKFEKGSAAGTNEAVSKSQKGD